MNTNFATLAGALIWAEGHHKFSTFTTDLFDELYEFIENPPFGVKDIMTSWNIKLTETLANSNAIWCCPVYGMLRMHGLIGLISDLHDLLEFEHYAKIRNELVSKIVQGLA